jgi:glycosyltransferase involved in cell wall biosynthesis
MLSIIIPAYFEPYLDKTIKSIFDNATTEIEVIVILDGWQPEQIDERVRVIKFDENGGMREAINAGIEMARGEFILKTDAHCSFARGFDEVLIRDYQEDWLLAPRTYQLNAEIWKTNNIFFDYYYLSFPDNKGKYGYSITACATKLKNDIPIDDTMMFPGTCWFTKKDTFLKYVGKLNSELYGKIGGEQIEVGLNYWLKGGAIKVDKNTWYGHFSKRRAFHLLQGKNNYGVKRTPEALRGREQLTKHWLNNEEPGIIHNFEWLIQKFWSISHSFGGWPENWKEVIYNIKYKYL